MTNGIFKRLGTCGYARAANVMSTQSKIGFEWSVKLFGTFTTYYVGIASQIKTEESIYISQMCISTYDQNAILYCASGDSTAIKIGSTLVHSNLTKHNNKDVIRFRFQPDEKKLVITLVRI